MCLTVTHLVQSDRCDTKVETSCAITFLKKTSSWDDWCWKVFEQTAYAGNTSKIQPESFPTTAVFATKLLFSFCFASLVRIDLELFQLWPHPLPNQMCAQQFLCVCLFFFLSSGRAVLAQLLHSQLQKAPPLTLMRAKKWNHVISKKPGCNMGLHVGMCKSTTALVGHFLVESNTCWTHVPFHAEIISMAFIAVLQKHKTLKTQNPSSFLHRTLGVACLWALYNFTKQLRESQWTTLPFQHKTWCCVKN